MISLSSPVETRAHGWPAGIKLAALCGATLALFALQNILIQTVFFVLMLALYALPGRSFCAVGLGRLRMLWPFVVLLLLWHGFSGELGKGTVIALRMITAVGLANLVTMTTRLSDMSETLAKVLRPLERFGIKTDRITLAMALVIRFTPQLLHKGQILRQSWRARARARVGWRIVLPFTILAIDDAEHVAEALRARGGL